MENVVFVYGGVAVLFWGGVLALGFRALRAWRQERSLERESRAQLDARLASLERELSAVRQQLGAGSRPSVAGGEVAGRVETQVGR